MYQYQQSLPYLSLKFGSPPVATRDLVIFMFCSTLEWCCGDDEPSSSPPTTLHCTGSSCPAYQLTFLSPLAKHSGSVQRDIGIFSNLGGPGPGPGRQYWKVGSISLSARPPPSSSCLLLFILIFLLSCPFILLALSVAGAHFSFANVKTTWLAGQTLPADRRNWLVQQISSVGCQYKIYIQQFSFLTTSPSF